MKKKCAFSHHLIAFYLGEVSPAVTEKMKAHLETCLKCQHNLALLEGIIKAGQDIKRDIEKEIEAMNWEEVAWLIQKKIKEEAAHPFVRKPGLLKLLLLRWPVVAGVACGIFFGFLISFYFLKSKGETRGPGLAYQVPASFLIRVDEELARREVIDYLEKSRLILLSLRQSSEEAPSVLGLLPQEKIRQLRLQKNYFTPHLGSFRLAKARAILGEIDSLLLELATIKEMASSDETAQLARLIEERHLLLKIQLLKQELEESEGKT